MVERGKTGLDKGLDSNIFHLRSALSRVRLPPQQAVFACFSELNISRKIPVDLRS